MEHPLRALLLPQSLAARLGGHEGVGYQGIHPAALANKVETGVRKRFQVLKGRIANRHVRSAFATRQIGLLPLQKIPAEIDAVVGV